ncbi:MAG: amino acid racemase [Trueperaceae bacterium]|nr:amino acid racemase [Trueperaceae bacterium]
MDPQRRTLGILGGMGPQATLDLMRRVIARTPAQREADHVHMLVDLNPHVPARVPALDGTGPSPGPELARMTRSLVEAGAEVLVMPCNTAHAWADEITAATNVPFLHMIDLAVDAALAGPSAPQATGILATRGTRRARLYHDRFEARGVAVLDADEEAQARLDAVIAGVKIGADEEELRAELRSLVDGLARRGAPRVLLGCTELAMVAPNAGPVPLLDPAEVLAGAIVRACTGVPRTGA